MINTAQIVFDNLDLRNCIFSFLYTTITAAKTGNLFVFKYRKDDPNFNNKLTNIIYFSIERGHLNVVKWLYENNINYSTLSSSLISFKINNIKYDNYLIHCAAKCGHLHIVKWLHYNTSEQCTYLAMNNAAENGYLDVVKFLHNNRQEGCTTNAMDYAAKNGHIEVVKFLYENRKEGCTTHAIEYAEKNGHLDIVKFIYKNNIEDKRYQLL